MRTFPGQEHQTALRVRLVRVLHHALIDPAQLLPLIVHLVLGLLARPETLGRVVVGPEPRLPVRQRRRSVSAQPVATVGRRGLLDALNDTNTTETLTRARQGIYYVCCVIVPCIHGKYNGVPCSLFLLITFRR